MAWTLALVAVILWLLGLLGNAPSPLIHALAVLAVLIVIGKLVADRWPV
jgi:hypothetical protein